MISHDSDVARDNNKVLQPTHAMFDEEQSRESHQSHGRRTATIESQRDHRVVHACLHYASVLRQSATTRPV